MKQLKRLGVECGIRAKGGAGLSMANADFFVVVGSSPLVAAAHPELRVSLLFLMVSSRGWTDAGG